MTRHLLLLATPALLVAQAPAPAPVNYIAVFQKEGPAIDQLLKDLKFQEALEKAEGLLPKEVAPFDKATFGGAYNSYLRLWATSRLYAQAGKAAQACGQWEKSLEHFKKAVEIGKGNAESTKDILGKGIEAYKQDILGKKGMIEGNAEYVKRLKELQSPTEDEKKQIAMVDQWHADIATAEKWQSNFQKAIDHAKADADSIAQNVPAVEKFISDETETLDKYKFKNDKVKYVEGIVSSKPYLDSIRTNLPKGDQLSFFLRLAVLDPANKKVQQQIDLLQGKATAPLAPEKPAKKKGK